MKLLLNLDKYKDIPFDYEDFINNEIFNIEYYLGWIEDYMYELHPAVIQMLIIDVKLSIHKLKTMLSIPDDVLDDAVSRWYK